MNSKKAIRFFFFVLLSLPKTIVFNFLTLPIRQAIKLPILIGYNVRIESAHRGVISFSEDTPVRSLMIRIGFGGTRVIVPNRYGVINIDKGTLIFHGQATFAAGSTLDCSGHLEIGNHFSTNRNAFVSCSNEVVIGDNVMLGWGVTIFDANGHTVYYKGEPKNSQVPIHIGNHVWLCSNSQILKGAEIGNGSIVAWGSILTKTVNKSNILIAGIPAKEIQEDISWGPFIGI